MTLNCLTLMAYIDSFFEVLVEPALPICTSAKASRRRCASTATSRHPRGADHARGSGLHDERNRRAGELAALRGARRPRLRLRDGSSTRASAAISSSRRTATARSSVSSRRRSPRSSSSAFRRWCKEFGHLRGGLVLVTGPTGSGKSTTLAALIDYINDELLAAHHHGRGADRVRAREQAQHHHAARSADQRRLVSRRPEGRAARRCGHRARRRNARPRNDLARAHRRGDRPARLRHPAHEQRAQDRRPHDRRLPREQAGAGAHDAREFAARRGRPVAHEERPTAAAASR